MQEEPIFSTLVADLRSPQGNLLARIAASLTSGLVLAALGVAMAWTLGMRHGGRVADADLATGLFVAGIVWCAAIFWIWSRMRRAGFAVAALVGTTAVAIVAGLGGYLIDEWLSGDEEFLILADVLMAIAAVVLLWTRAAYLYFQGRSVLDGEGLVRVHCPDCGYSLIGLRDLRCPECGREFTIDELIRVQGYASSGQATLSTGAMSQAKEQIMMPSTS